MSKRRISTQQSVRIEKKQQHYRDASSTTAERPTEEGLVIKRFARHAQIEDNTGKITHCSIRPTIDSLVAGDRVVWQKQGVRQGVVVSRFPRQSVLGRPDKQGRLKPIAANITQMMVVIAPKPDITWSLLDSYLVMADHLKLNACIVLNKTDLDCEALRQVLLTHYQPLGYPLIFIGRHEGCDYQPLQEALNKETSVFVGQSGVGKSSLIARILPEEADRIQTGEISAISELGCHTTSNACLYHLAHDGALIDSPGIRELSLFQLTPREIAEGFREFKPYLSECKYRNCNHLDAPGCALLAAVKNKKVSHLRYENYVKILAK